MVSPGRSNARRSGERWTCILTHTVSAPCHAFGSCVRSPNTTLIHLASAGSGMFRFIHREKSVLCLHLPQRNTILHHNNYLLSLPASASRCAQQSLGFSRCLNQVSRSHQCPWTIKAHLPISQGAWEHRHLHPTSLRPPAMRGSALGVND